MSESFIFDQAQPENIPKKITDEQAQEIAEKYVGGSTHLELAAEYGVCKQSIGKLLRTMGVERPRQSRTTPKDLTEFAKRARSILWRQDRSKEKPTYERWLARVAELESPDGGGYKRNQAIVRASKEYPCLHRLFREYNVSEYDPNPESHPTIQHFGKVETVDDAHVICEGIEQSYRDSLRWAIEAAGLHLRTNKLPVTCPCDAAWYLFKQALDEPKDFLSRVGQIESKGDNESEERRNARKIGNRSIAEIDSMLSELSADNDGT